MIEMKVAGIAIDANRSPIVLLKDGTDGVLDYINQDQAKALSSAENQTPNP